jgi:hypothetical protein
VAVLRPPGNWLRLAQRESKRKKLCNTPKEELARGAYTISCASA